MDIRIVYGEWLDERRKAGMTPLSSDAHIHIMALIERFEAAQQSVQADECVFCTQLEKNHPNNVCGVFCAPPPLTN